MIDSSRLYRPAMRAIPAGLALVLAACGGGGSTPGAPDAPRAAPSAAAPFPLPPPASCTFGPGWSASTNAVLNDFDPPVVDARAPETVALKVKTSDPSVDAVSVALASGGVVPLAPSGRDLFCVLLTPSQTLAGYGPQEAQHHFVGFLDFSRGGTRLSRRNLFLDVADAQVPEVAVERIAEDMQASAHALNVFVPGVPPATLDFPSVTRRLYQAYPDAYDFVALVSVPAFTGNRFHVTVHNEVQGTGVPLSNGSGAYGSAGRLLGLNRYPIAYFFDLGQTGSIHEIGHQWINFLSLPALRPGVPHWPLSSLAYGVMGFSIGGGGGEGGQFSYQLSPVGGGDYRLDPRPAATAFNDMELYLMGLAPPESVGPHVVPSNQSQPVCGGCILRGPVATVTVQDVIAAHGPRVPAFPSAPTRFAVATVVVSMDRPLTAREMAFFDYFAARGEATTPLPFTSGFASGTTLPFAPATGGRGSLVTALGARLR